MTLTGTFPLGKRNLYSAVLRSANPYRGLKPLAGYIICTYAIESAATSMAYVGSTEDLNRRWNLHVGDLRHGKHKNAGLQELYDLLGIEDLSIRILSTYDSTDDLLTHEYTDGLKHYAVDDLLNVRLGNKFLKGQSPRSLARSSPRNRKPTQRPGIQSKPRWFDGQVTL